jgi:hypothetical protein
VWDFAGWRVIRCPIFRRHVPFINNCGRTPGDVGGGGMGGTAGIRREAKNEREGAKAAGAAAAAAKAGAYTRPLSGSTSAHSVG